MNRWLWLLNAWNAIEKNRKYNWNAGDHTFSSSSVRAFSSFSVKDFILSWVLVMAAFAEQDKKG